MWSNSRPHFGVHIWTQKWGQPSENFVAARKCFASRFATQQLEHECQHIPFSLCASQGRLLLSRSLNRSHVLNTFFGPVLGAMMKQVCWHSRRSEAHRGLPEARPRTQNVMARGQSEAHGDSNLYNTRQDWMIWNQKNAGDDHQPRYPLLSWNPAVQNEDTCSVWDLNFKAHADFRPSICSASLAK